MRVAVIIIYIIYKGTSEGQKSKDDGENADAQKSKIDINLCRKIVTRFSLGCWLSVKL